MYILTPHSPVKGHLGRWLYLPFDFYVSVFFFKCSLDITQKVVAAIRVAFTGARALAGGYTGARWY